MGVEDVVWDPSQTYFVSTSTDQTTRAFACWTRGAGATNVFHEIARPLTHGFDMACAAFVRSFIRSISRIETHAAYISYRFAMCRIASSWAQKRSSCAFLMRQ